MKFKILAPLALTLGAAFFPFLALGDPKPALNEFEVQVQAFSADAYGRLAGQVSIRRANALPFETSYDTSFFATEFPSDQQGYMRVNARLGDGNLYAATIIRSEPGELPGMPMMHAHATLLGAGPPPPSPPAAITDLAATSNEDQQSTLTWSAAAGADSYDVYVSQMGNPFTLANGGAGEDVTSPFVVLNLSNGVLASFKVVARGEGGDTESNVATATSADTVAPDAPTDLAATPGDGQVTLTWTASAAADLAGYRIFRKEPLLSYSQLATGVTGTEYIDETAVNGTAYDYKMQAYDEVPNYSSDSEEVSATPVAALPAPLMDFDATVVESVTLAGADVDGWADQSANADDLSASASAKPSYTSGVCLVSDDEYLLFDNPPSLGTESDLFMVCDVGNFAYGYLLYTDASNYIRVAYNGVVTYRAGATNLSWSIGSVVDGAFRIYRFKRDGDDVTLYVNGVADDTENSASYPEVSITAATRAAYGAGSNPARYAGLRLFASALSDSEALAVTEDLATIHSITLP